MSRILVTGATGFVGYRLAKRLLEDGHDVRILVRPNRDISSFDFERIEVARGDVTDIHAVKAAMHGVETVYHIAAVFRSAALPDSVYWATNYHGTQNMLQAAVNEGVNRFVYCSTCGVQGNIRNPPAKEDAPYNPGDVYQRSKAKAEQDVLKAHADLGLPVTVIRPVAVYGPGDSRWLKLFRSIARRRFVMLGSGETLIHMVYIYDLVEAFCLAAQNPSAVGQVYTIGGEKYVTLNELARIIAAAVGVPEPKLRFPFWPVRLLSGVVEDACRIVGVEPPVFRRRIDLFVKNRAFDITRSKVELGFQPKVSLEEGVRLTAAWYKSQGML
ncbi:MAG: NAD-dependent epimerase/dehydratase family protein [Armatimonadota bacterium]